MYNIYGIIVLHVDILNQNYRWEGFIMKRQPQQRAGRAGAALALAICMTLVALLPACDSEATVTSAAMVSAETAAVGYEGDLEPVELIWYMPNGAQKDMQEVIDAFNVILKGRKGIPLC